MLILFITFANAFPTKNQTSKIQDYSNSTESTLGSNYSAPFFEGSQYAGGSCCDSGCFVNCSAYSMSGAWFLDEEARTVTKFFQTAFHPTIYAMKVRRPHFSITHGVVMPTIVIGGHRGHYSLVLNLAHAVIAIRSKQQTSVAGMLKATPQAAGPRLLHHRAVISSPAT